MITIVNRRTAGKVPEGTVRVYIGRPSPLGNQFSHLENTIARFKVSDRETAIAAYKHEFWSSTGSFERRRELARLKELAATQNVELECWCAPLACHGEVIKEYLQA